MSDDIPRDQWMNAKAAFNPPIIGKKEEKKVDIPISKAVGKTILLGDSRVLRMIVKWKQEKGVDNDNPDNFLKDPKKIEELKKELSK